MYFANGEDGGDCNHFIFDFWNSMDDQTQVSKFASYRYVFKIKINLKRSKPIATSESRIGDKRREHQKLWNQWMK
jgi:hypothetical protein